MQLKDDYKNYIEEDEIDLKELFEIIWKYKIKIAFFTFIVTTLTILYSLSIPNSYKSETILIPQEQAKPSLGGLGALAGMAGIDIGGGSSIDAATSFNTIFNDFDFQKKIIKKYNLNEKLKIKTDNLVFALGYDGIYKLLKGEKKEDKSISLDELTFNSYKQLLKMVSISTDKKSGLITISVESEDRFLSKELVELYLNELTTTLRDIEMKNVENQIKYYNQELEKTQDLSIKDQLSQLASGLVQKKVLSMANKFYNVKQFTKPQVSYIKDKSKPKRGLIVVVSFVTSIILGIFLVFFLEFIKKDED